MSPTTTTATRNSAPDPGAAAKVIDHIGEPGDPYRVTIIQLARVKETYEIRWRENVRHDDATITRQRATLPVVHAKSAAYTAAEKVHASLVRTSGFQGAPARAKGQPKASPAPKTVRQVADLWLAQHPSNADKPGTVEWYESLLRNNILPALSYTETHGRKQSTRTVELGPILADNLQETDINRWLIAVSAKPDGRRKDAAVAVSSSTVQSCLRVLTACLNWAQAHGHTAANPAATIEVTVHGRRVPEHFHTSEAFWDALDAIDAHNDGVLHNFLITLLYLGCRINELAALQWSDIDFTTRRVRLRHNFDKKHRDITVKTEDSEDWVPLHQEAETALLDQKHKAGRRMNGADLVFRAPRGGIITSGLVNAALAHGCQATNLGYRVTAHGLRHSFATWLKNEGIPTSDIQKLLRHSDPRTTAGYLHTTDQQKISAVSKLPGRNATSASPPPGNAPPPETGPPTPRTLPTEPNHEHRHSDSSDIRRRQRTPTSTSNRKPSTGPPHRQHPGPLPPIRPAPGLPRKPLIMPNTQARGPPTTSIDSDRIGITATSA